MNITDRAILMQYIDSHAHLSDPAVLPHIARIMESADAAGVSKVVNICTSVAALEEGLLLAKRYPGVYNAAATPPHDVGEGKDDAFFVFAKAAQEQKLVAIGETGLDYFYKELDPQLQKEFLIRYLHLAHATQLPVIFHCREAFHDLFAIADLEYPQKSPAIVHCFTGSLQEAEQVFARGWYLSFSGIATFKKSEDLREVARMAPLDQLLIETDTPFLAPQSHRGKMNEPAFVVEIAACIAKARDMALEDVAKATSENAKRVFGI